MIQVDSKIRKLVPESALPLIVKAEVWANSNAVQWKRERTQRYLNEYATEIIKGAPQETTKDKEKKVTFHRRIRMLQFITGVNLDDIMPGAIRIAMLHARRVGSSPKHKADRNERVGFFVTDLRREIIGRIRNSDSARKLIEILCSKALWRDAGELETGARISPISADFNTETLHRWATVARLSNGDDDPFLEIDSILAEVQEDTQDLRALSDHAVSATNRAEAAANDLQNFMVQLAAS